MKPVTPEYLADLLHVMTIKQSIDIGFAITHHGFINGVPIMAISTRCGDCFVIQ